MIHPTLLAALARERQNTFLAQAEADRLARPARLARRRARTSGAPGSPLNRVTNRLPASNQALRVRGSILRYERIKRDQGYEVAVAFEMRVEQDSGEPIIEQTYTAQAMAADDTVAGTVRAFGTAVDQAFAKFYGDLAALTKDTHAG